MTNLGHRSQILSVQRQNEVAEETLDLLEYSGELETERTIFCKQLLVSHLVYLFHELADGCA